MPKDICNSQINTIRILKSHRDRKVSRDLGAQGLTSGPWRNSITCISLGTTLTVSGISTVIFFFSLTQNHNVSSILLFRLVKSISKWDMSTEIKCRLFLKAKLKRLFGSSWFILNIRTSESTISAHFFIILFYFMLFWWET